MIHTGIPTDRETLTAYREALIALATAQSYTILGKMVTHANIKDIRETINWLEDRIYLEENPNDAFGMFNVDTGL